jgi:hypothetical protein
MHWKLLLLAALGIVPSAAADAHSWYEGLTSPRGERCCSGPWDCPAVDLRYDPGTGRPEVAVDGAWVPVDPATLVAMPSADGQAHVCSWRNWHSDGTVTTVVRCVILPGNV